MHVGPFHICSDQKIAFIGGNEAVVLNFAYLAVHQFSD